MKKEKKKTRKKINKCLKELRHNILIHFFDGQNYGLSVAKPQ